MNRDDARVVTTTMQSMWPSHSWRDGECDRLVDHLLTQELPDVMAALGVLECTQKFFPHWSEMVDVLGGIKRRRREALEVETEFGDQPVSAERAREYIAQCRAIVAGWKPDHPMKAALEKGWQ